jgi:peptidoglycan/LPS O-acetylase OafA/YrhL
VTATAAQRQNLPSFCCFCCAAPQSGHIAWARFYPSENLGARRLKQTVSQKVEIRALTGFRGVAALLVVLYHFSNALGADATLSIPSGYIAVDAFFVLSGYVLAYNYQSLLSKEFAWNAYGDFLYRRLCRIYPAYFVILLLAYAKLALNYSGSNGLEKLGVWDAICNFFMLTGWGLGAQVVLGVSWSVSAELFCYILFPGLLLFSRARSLALGVLALALFGVVVFLSRFGGGVVGPLDIVAIDSFYPLLRAAAGFSIGIVGYGLTIRAKRLDGVAADFALAISMLLLLIVWRLDTTDLLKYALLACIVWLVAQDTRLGKLLFGNSAVYYAGEISYSLYLIHPLVLNVSIKAATRFQQFIGVDLTIAFPLLLYMSISIGLSAISYKLLEQGGKRLMLSLRRTRMRSIAWPRYRE